MLHFELQGLTLLGLLYKLQEQLCFNKYRCNKRSITFLIIFIHLC